MVSRVDRVVAAVKRAERLERELQETRREISLLVGDSLTARPDTLRARVYAYAVEHGQVTAEASGELGTSRATLRTYLSSMSRPGGQLKRIRHGVYRPSKLGTVNG